MLKENENLKKELSDILSEAKNNSYPRLEVEKKQSSDLMLINEINNIKNSIQYKNIPFSDYHKINLEYLKNVLIKYLEAISIGDEFQIKILENVIFTILDVSNDEKLKLEEKRSRSSFYYNLWYNAKAFLSARIYGTSSDDIFENRKSTEEINIEL